MSTKKAVKKVKNVLIISASFRPNSNSHALCQEVAKGVKAAGNKAEVIWLKDKKIGFCTGCYACQKLGKCVIQDDANAIVGAGAVVTKDVPPRTVVAGVPAKVIKE